MTNHHPNPCPDIISHIYQHIQHIKQHRLEHLTAIHTIEPNKPHHPIHTQIINIDWVKELEKIRLNKIILSPQSHAQKKVSPKIHYPLPETFDYNETLDFLNKQIQFTQLVDDNFILIHIRKTNFPKPNKKHHPIFTQLTQVNWKKSLGKTRFKKPNITQPRPKPKPFVAPPSQSIHQYLREAMVYADVIDFINKQCIEIRSHLPLLSLLQATDVVKPNKKHRRLFTQLVKINWANELDNIQLNTTTLPKPQKITQPKKTTTPTNKPAPQRYHVREHIAYQTVLDALVNQCVGKPRKRHALPVRGMNYPLQPPAHWLDSVLQAYRNAPPRPADDEPATVEAEIVHETMLSETDRIIQQLQQEIADLKQQNRELNELLGTQDSEIKNKDEKITQLTQQNLNLQSMSQYKENRRVDSDSPVLLRYGKEVDLYDDEILSFIRKSFESSLQNQVHENSRHRHILEDLLAANLLPKDIRDSKKNELQRIMNAYSRMDNATRQNLVHLGFSISEDGAHYKLVFAGDRRYTFTTSKTSSDMRAGKNFSRDVSNLLF